MNAYKLTNIYMHLYNPAEMQCFCALQYIFCFLPLIKAIDLSMEMVCFKPQPSYATYEQTTKNIKLNPYGYILYETKVYLLKCHRIVYQNHPHCVTRCGWFWQIILNCPHMRITAHKTRVSYNLLMSSKSQGYVQFWPSLQILQFNIL